MLAHELLGFEPLADDRYQLWFGPIFLGLLLEKPKGKHRLIKNLLPTLQTTDAPQKVLPM